MRHENLKNGYFIGIVEDNIDSEHKQRVRVRVPFLHGEPSEIPTDSLPWARPERDLDGKSFSIPDVNKVVSVKFPTGSPYMPVYCESLHLDKNLQNKLEEYSDNMSEFKAFCYDYNTQIYKDDEQLSISYKFNSLDISDSAMTMAFKDQNTKFFIGDEDADEAMVLGTSFMEYFDSFLDTLINGFICNGIPVIAAPNLVTQIMQFKTLYKLEYLSQNAFISQNFNIKSKNIEVFSDTGDEFDITEKEKNVSVDESSAQPKKVDFMPLPEGVDKIAVEESGFNAVIGHVNGEDIYAPANEPQTIEEMKEVSKPDETPVTKLATTTGTSTTKKIDDQPDVEVRYGQSDFDYGFSDDDLYQYEDINFDELIANADAFVVDESDWTTSDTADVLPDVAFEMPIKVKTTTNKINTIKKLERYMRSKNYSVYNEPGILNIVGFRNNVKESGKVTNTFDDKLITWFYDTENNLNYYEYVITTTPGFAKGKKHLPAGPSGAGVAMMWYGQYEYKIKYHLQKKYGTEHPCLGLSTNLYVRNKPNGDRYYNKNEAKDKVQKGAIGLNIHASVRDKGQASYLVNNWSEGCQVFKKANDWKEFMALCFNQRDKHNKSTFMYALISEKEFINFK